MHILKYPDNQLESHWPGTMIDLFEAHPRAMVHRTQRGTGFTLIHGDVNPGNILVPHEGDRSPEGERWGRVHYALTVPRETLKTAISHLREHGSEVYGPADIRWMRSRSYYFFDPDGNLLEFWSPEIGDTRCRGRRCCRDRMGRVGRPVAGRLSTTRVEVGRYRCCPCRYCRSSEPWLAPNRPGLPR